MSISRLPPCNDIVNRHTDDSYRFDVALDDAIDVRTSTELTVAVYYPLDDRMFGDAICSVLREIL